MKKFFVIFGLVFVCITAFAHSIEWYVDGSLYQTTTCDAGDNITPPTAPEKYGYHFVEWNAYTQLEYIESTGTQWIDTGLAGNDNYIIKGKFYDFGSGNSVVSGSNSRYGTNYIGRVSGSGSSYRFLISKKKCEILASSGIHEFKISPEKVVFDGVEYDWSADHNSIGSKLYLFYGYYHGEILGRIRLYYYQVELNDVLLRDYIPARRNSDNVVGMYDTVSGTFFTNAGTGEFIAGPEVGDL